MIVSSKTVRRTNSPGAKPSIAPSNSTVVAVRFIYPTCVMSQSGILSLSPKSHGYSSHVIGVSTTFMVTNSPGVRAINAPSISTVVSVRFLYSITVGSE